MKERIVGTLEKKKSINKSKRAQNDQCSSCYRVFKLLPGVQAATGWIGLIHYVSLYTSHNAKCSSVI